MPYVDVGFGPAYFWVSGEGEPVVVLHGGGFGFGAGMLSRQLADLAAAGFTVYAPERVGHGRTADREGRYSYEAMADETSAFIESVIGTPVHLVGWSDGMRVGALVVMKRPDLVDRFIGMAGSFNASGNAVDPKEFGDELRADPWPSLVESYAALSPDGPEHLTTFLGKLTDLWLEMPQIDLDALSTIHNPVLLVQGDDDMVRVEHSAAAARALGNGRLAVLPGTHLFPVDSPDLLDPIMIAFLRDQLQPTPDAVAP